LLSTIGTYVFWTQLGIGIFLTISLAITFGLMMWYRSRLFQSSSQKDEEGGEQELDDKADPTSDQKIEPKSDPQVEHKQDPIEDLNSAWDNADSQSLYDNPPRDLNPFIGWSSHSSFRPLGPPQAVPESLPMIQRPVAVTDKSTMTSETQEALSTLKRNAIQSKQGARARWTESTEQLNLVQEQLLSATLSHLEQAGYYTRPLRYLPPQTPLRTSSLRGSRRNKRGRQERNIHRSEDQLPVEESAL
jgi:hypothetical protein